MKTMILAEIEVYDVEVTPWLVILLALVGVPLAIAGLVRVLRRQRRAERRSRAR